MAIFGVKNPFSSLFESCSGVVQKLILSDFPLLWGPAVGLNEKKPKVFDCLDFFHPYESWPLFSGGGW